MRTALSVLYASAHSPGLRGTYSFQSSDTSSAVLLRHCSYELYATATDTQGPSTDFDWNVVPGLNGQSNSISLQSKKYPTKYVSIITTEEDGRLGLGVPANKDDASFSVVSGLSNSSLYSLKSLSKGPHNGAFVTKGQKLSGKCSREYKQKGEGDAVLSDGSNKVAATWIAIGHPPPRPPHVTVDLNTVTHQISPLTMGCHSDSGYSHQARGFYSQMIVGDSFNANNYPDGRWNTEVRGSVVFNSSQDSTESFFGTPSQLFSYQSGSGTAGLSNRGLGNAGMVFEEGKEYEGFIFAKGRSASVDMTVSLEDYVTQKVLASATLHIDSSKDEFVRYNFTLVPSESTFCADIVDPAREPNISCGSGKPLSAIGHACVKCGGQFKLSLSAPSDVYVNYAFLQPGQAMGIRAIRQGGSYASKDDGSAAYYQWQKWTGPAWTRPSRTDGVWKACLLAGWGPFEMIDMCNALDIEPIITTTESSSPSEFADLVEYCWGNHSTTMGAKRVSDGHPEQYRVKFFELGNEQYNSDFVEQVAAMETRASALGMPNAIHYMFPSNQFLNDADIAKASKLSPRLDPLMVADLHVGGGGAVEAARELFASRASFEMGAVNAETNAGTHTFERAMSEATDLNDWFNAADVSGRLLFRAASFCMGESNDFDAWDQGISFFLPNMTWLQPPGYVHQMIAQTWQPSALNVSYISGASATSFSAQKSEDGKILVLRYANVDTTEQNVTVDIIPSVSAQNAKVWTLSAEDGGAANTPANPTAISPIMSTLPSFQSGDNLTVPPYSYTVVQLQFSQ